MLQRQVSFICCLLYDLLTGDNFNHHHQLNQQYHYPSVNSCHQYSHSLDTVFIKPYKRRILNSLDGLISQVTIIVTVTSFIDSFSPGLLLSIIILLVILPLIAFVTMELIVYNENIKNIITYFKPKPDTTNPNLILQTQT